MNRSIGTPTFGPIASEHGGVLMIKLSRPILTGAALVAALAGGTAWAAGSTSAGPRATPQDTTPTASNYVPMTPCRVVDTRGSFNGPIGPIQAGTTMTFDFGYRSAEEQGGEDSCYVPDNATAVQATITATEAEGPGSLTAFPWNTPEHATTVLSYDDSGNATSGTVLGLNSLNATIHALTSTVQVVIDIHGYYLPAPPPPLTAQVSTSGALVRSSGGVTSSGYQSSVHPGYYQVFVDHPVDNCTFQVTPGVTTTGYTVAAYVPDSNHQSVIVQLRDTISTNTQGYFSLTGVCP